MRLRVIKHLCQVGTFETIKKLFNSASTKSYLNRQTSLWLNVTAGVPQDSVLRLLFFLIYINDLPNEVISSFKIFADDTSLFSQMRTKATVISP